MKSASGFLVVLALAVANVLTEEDADHVFFKRIGQTYTTRGYMHVSVKISTPTIGENIQTTYNFMKKLQGMDKHHGRVAIARHLDELEKLKSKVETYLQLGHTLSAREKRQLGIIFGIASTFLGAYNAYEISQIKGQVAVLDTAVTDLFHEVDEQKTALAEQGLAISRLEEATNITIYELTHFEQYTEAVQLAASLVEAVRMQAVEMGSVIDVLMSHRLSVKVLHPGAMYEILRQVQSEAYKSGYALLPKNPGEAYQCKASFEATHYGINAILHIPLAREGDRMIIYEYLSVPIPVGAGGLQISVHPEHPIIATDERRTVFLTMTLNTLAKCKLLGANYVCEGANTRQLAVAKAAEFEGEPDPALCTFFLLTRQQENVKKACAVQLHKAQSQVFELSGTEFVFVERVAHEGALTCKGKEVEHIHVNGARKVTVPPGCEFTTHTASATGVLDLATNATPVSYKWDMDPEAMLHGLDLEYYQQLVDAVDVGKTRIPRDVRDVHEWLDAKARWNSHANLTYSSVGTWVAVGAAFLVIIGLVCYFKWRRSEDQEERARDRRPAAHSAITVHNHANPVYKPYARTGQEADNAYNQFRTGLA